MSTKKKYDLSRNRKIYPLIRRKPKFLNVSSVESSRLTYANDEYSKTFIFQTPYATAPACVATAENDNVNVYITSVNLNNVTVEISNSPGIGNTTIVNLHIHEVSQ